LIFLFVFLITISWSRPPALPTVEGPEDSGLLKGKSGYIVINLPEQGMIAISVPGLERKIILPPGGIGKGLHNISGPDKTGRIAFIYSDMGSFFSWRGKHSLRTVRLDGQGEDAVFERSGDAVTSHEIGESLAWSAQGGNVAFVSNIEFVQMRNPDAYLAYGKLEIWNVDSKKAYEVNETVLDSGFSWFPNAEQLAYVALVPRSDIPKEPWPDPEAFEDISWPEIPVVKIYDLTSGESRILHVGWDPVVSPDGMSLVASLPDAAESPIIVDVRTGESRMGAWPGTFWNGVIAYVDSDTILYRGLPTVGAEPKLGVQYSPLVGKKQLLTLKIADINSGAFMTVVDYVDRRHEVSFGRTA